MGHGGESVVSNSQNHHSGNYHPHVGGPNSKRPSNSLTKVNVAASGGICHSHENSKGSSSKVSKKSHSNNNSQSNSSKAVNVGKARQSQGNSNYNNHHNNSNNNGVKANVGTSLQHYHQQHLMKQQALAGRQWTPRQKSFSPPTLHPMPSGEAKSRTASPVVVPGSKNKEHFYAGARFETHPSHIGLPVPPSHWTAPLQRSQSQPTSPVPTTVPQKGISVDLATLFGRSSDSALKSASFPGERLMDALVKMEDERKKKKQMETNASIDGKRDGSLATKVQTTTKDDFGSKNETDELKKALGLTFTPPVKAVSQQFGNVGYCSNGSEMSTSKYQDISDQLKTLLKVAA